MELHSDEIHLYFASPEEISDPGLLSLYKSLLSEQELAQMPRFYFERHRHQYLVTRALIRSCLSHYHELEPHEWCFDKNAYGKPGLAPPHDASPIRFNISHTDGLILCGIVRDIDIGVDVEDENRTTRSDIDGLSGYFSPREVEELCLLPEEKQKQRFFDYWTLKESYIKARGMGLALPLSQFSFIFENDQLKDFIVQPELKDTAEHWRFWRFAMAKHYKGAVAVKSETTNFKVIAKHSVPLECDQSASLSFL